MELISPIRVVVVDDNASHLISIANGLARAGIPCTAHLYDIDSSSLIPPIPAGGYPHLRMIVTDLNIREMVGANAEPPSLASTLISEVLQPLVSPTAGPYCVCLWTSTGSKAEEVLPLIVERISHESRGADARPAPLIVNILEKGHFVQPADAMAAEALAALFKADNGTELRDLIATKLSSDPQLSAVLAWESRASIAAAKTINNVYRVSANETSGEVKASRALQIVLAKIAVDAAGIKNANDHPGKALDDGLSDLFQDEMSSSVSSQPYASAAKKVFSGVTAPALTPKSRTALNTVLHIEKPVLGNSKIERGLVLDINSDDKLRGLGLPKSREVLLFDEFLCNSGLLERDLANAQGTGNKDLIAECERRKAFYGEHKAAALANSRIVMIEIGADCDHAQRKDRTLRFLLGAEIPSPYADLARTRSPLKNSLRDDALRELSAWELNGEAEFQLLVSLSRFAVQQKWLRDEALDIRYRLRKPIVEQVLHWYSTHSTRPGIITIT